jgi:hypothetical protein
LISTLPTRKASQIWEVVEKQDAIVVMFIDWFCSIFEFFIDFSPPSLPNGVESKDGLRLGLGVISSDQLDDGVSSIGVPLIKL